MSIFIALLILSFLIFFHEFGHFSAARYFGVHVEVFSIGFGKRLFTKKLGDTEFSFSMIPLGGYVKMKGQDDSDPSKRSTDDDSYSTKSPLQRIVILLAGPFANFVLAFIIFFILTLNTSETFGGKIGQVTPNSPAFTAGLQKGDIIERVNGTNISTWDDFVGLIKEDDGAIELIINRNNALQKVIVKREILDVTNEFKEHVKRKLIGVQLDPTFMVPVNYGVFESLSQGLKRTYTTSKMIFTGIEKLVEGVVPAKELGGVISIVDITSKASQSGILALLFFTALISVNLGVLNLLPIPALDGGHVMFNLYELLTKKAPSEKVMVNITIGGWVLLLSLMALGMYNDISRIIERF